MGIEKLAEVTGLTYVEARQSYALYHRLTPQLKRWWRQAEADFRMHKEAFNPFGRRLKVIQRIDDEVLESIVAFYPQSTIGDHICRVWYQSAEDDKWPTHTARIAINVHDSLTGIVAMTKRDDAKRALTIMKRYAETPIMIQDAWHNPAEPLIIPAECKISRTIGHDKHHRWSNLETVRL